MSMQVCELGRGDIVGEVPGVAVAQSAVKVFVVFVCWELAHTN